MDGVSARMGSPTRDSSRRDWPRSLKDIGQGDSCVWPDQFATVEPSRTGDSATIACAATNFQRGILIPVRVAASEDAGTRWFFLKVIRRCGSASGAVTKKIALAGLTSRGLSHKLRNQQWP